MPKPNSHALWSLPLALVMIAITAILPLLWKETPVKMTPPDRVVQVSQLPTNFVPPDDDLTDERLEAQGYTVGRTYVYKTIGKPESPLASVLRWLMPRLSAAYTESENGGYQEITDLNDGNPNNAEIRVRAWYQSSYVTGVLKWNTNDISQAWVQSGTSYAKLPDPSLLDKVVCSVTEDVFAAEQGSCTGGFEAAGDILLNAFLGALYATGPSMWWCSGFWAGWGPCVAGVFALTFNFGIPYFTWDWYQTSGPGGPGCDHLGQPIMP
jgi:hypothetical protein